MEPAIRTAVSLGIINASINGAPFEELPYSTLNQKYNILPGINNGRYEYPRIGYYCIGLGDMDVHVGPSGVPKTITVVAPDLTNDNTPTITGTTDAEVGQVVTVEITDAAGNVQTVSTTVNPDGTYSVDAVTPLADGDYTAKATVSDVAGNTAEATDPGSHQPRHHRLSRPRHWRAGNHD